MQHDKHLALHGSQIPRLEQVMTALAEAQVKTEESTDRLDRAMAELDRAMAETNRAMAELATGRRDLRRRAAKAEAEARERGRILDERIANLVSAIGELIHKGK